jgi:hypothetical protein
MAQPNSPSCVAAKPLPGKVPPAISPEPGESMRRLAYAAPAGNDAIAKPHGENDPMALKAPGILTFMLSVILTVLAMVTLIFGASIPYITGQEFWVLLVAQVVLVFGCIMRGL